MRRQLRDFHLSRWKASERLVTISSHHSLSEGWYLQRHEDGSSRPSVKDLSPPGERRLAGMVVSKNYFHRMKFQNLHGPSLVRHRIDRQTYTFRMPQLR